MTFDLYAFARTQGNKSTRAATIAWGQSVAKDIKLQPSQKEQLNLLVLQTKQHNLKKLINKIISESS